MTTDTPELFADLLEVEHLFPIPVEISHSLIRSNDEFINDFTIGEKRYSFTDALNNDWNTLEFKRQRKRLAKLALYKALVNYFGVSAPWGALTGIRPTKLARETANFEDYFRDTMLVSESKINLTKEIIASQAPYYKLNDRLIDVYVGIPICPSRCYYCSFISALKEKVDTGVYAQAVKAEIEGARAIFDEYELGSIYLGGGTPVTLSAEELEPIFDALPFSRAEEITVEAGRPDALTDAHIALFKRKNVNRVCINPQTFNDETLSRIGRKHTASDIYRAYGKVKGDFSVNMDLIAGLDGESVDDFINSIKKTVELEPDNITVHTLSIKGGSKLKEVVSAQNTDGRVREMVDFSREYLKKCGYLPYYMYRQKYMADNLENVGYFLSGKKPCLYNIRIMEEISSNLAFGAGSISKRLFGAENRIERYAAPKDIPTYIAKRDEVIVRKNELFNVNSFAK